jgi:hypothetical protein
MVQYATASELASYLQQDLDTATATLLLTTASGLFDREAQTTFTATTATWSTTDANGCFQLDPPYRPITAVSAVRVNGVAVTGWVLRCNLLYRAAGFGVWRGYGWPPDQVDVDLTYGYSAVPDDVKAAVLESAAASYTRPVGAVAMEAIDDYRVQYATAGGVQLTPSAQAVAAGYRGVLIA